MSKTHLLQRRFAAIGARLRVSDGPWLGAPRVDVDDALGFELGFAGRGARAEAEVIDVEPADRHLLLLVRRESEKSKFLCGHDERHWFVAAIPEDARGVTGVETAKAALQPPIVAARPSACRASVASTAATPCSCARASGSSCPSRDVRGRTWPDPAQRAAGPPGWDAAHSARGVPSRRPHRLCQRWQGHRRLGLRASCTGRRARSLPADGP